MLRLSPAPRSERVCVRVRRPPIERTYTAEAVDFTSPVPRTATLSLASQIDDLRGWCVGVYDVPSRRWHCAAESLTRAEAAPPLRVRVTLPLRAGRSLIALVRDNCPEHYNPTQADADGDGRGDACQHEPARALDEAANSMPFRQ